MLESKNSHDRNPFAMKIFLFSSAIAFSLVSCSQPLPQTTNPDTAHRIETEDARKGAGSSGQLMPNSPYGYGGYGGYNNNYSNGYSGSRYHRGYY